MRVVRGRRFRVCAVAVARKSLGHEFERGARRRFLLLNRGREGAREVAFDARSRSSRTLRRVALVQGATRLDHQPQRRCLPQEPGVGVRRTVKRRRGASDGVQPPGDAVQDGGRVFSRRFVFVFAGGGRATRGVFQSRTVGCVPCHTRDAFFVCLALESHAERVRGARRAASATMFERVAFSARAFVRHSFVRQFRDVRAARDVQERVDDRFHVLVLRDSAEGHTSRSRQLEEGI